MELFEAVYLFHELTTILKMTADVVEQEFGPIPETATEDIVVPRTCTSHATYKDVPPIRDLLKAAGLLPASSAEPVVAQPMSF